MIDVVKQFAHAETVHLVNQKSNLILTYQKLHL